MGVIKRDVRDMHLSQFPEEESLIIPFKAGFDINWATHRKAYNTELSIYFLGPESFMAESFGFDHEIILAISNYETIEPRTMQAIESCFNDEPARGRVDQSIVFIITQDANGMEWVTTYTSRNLQSRIPVIFHISDIEKSRHEPPHIRNVISSQLFMRDLFDYQLPIVNDLHFFGRDAVIADYLDAIKRSQNRGLFGLRKTGKTSILYKLKRLAERDKIGKVLYYDCKLPAIRSIRWHKLLERVMMDISKSCNIELPRVINEIQISEAFINLLKSTASDKIICLIFDEIEYISPLSPLDVHWKEDFIPFWQTLWAAQSQVRRLSNIISGVNPSVVEIDVIGQVQNPMFGIVQPRYLRGFEVSELRSMLKFFGRRMGIAFSNDAIDYLHSRYGGHPLLTRLACSQVHLDLANTNQERPFKISAQYLRQKEESRDGELIFYCRHVVSELRQFYPDEYEMLEFLASGRINDFMEFRSAPEYTRHLRDYGLVVIDSIGKPKFALPVVGRYIGAELARREGRCLRRHVIPADSREFWVKHRANAITRELRELEQLINKHSSTELYGSSSFPEAEKFAAIRPCKSQEDFVKFINTCNRCFVESIERSGRSKRINNYYWIDIKCRHPDLWDALQRIKVYRHNDIHLELNASTEKELERYLHEDLEHRRISQVKSVWFILQQCVLDAMFLGAQCEINRLS